MLALVRQLEAGTRSTSAYPDVCLPACVESLILTSLSSTVEAWFLAFKYPEWESQLCHKENNWIGNVFSPGSRAHGVCGGEGCCPFLPESCPAVLLGTHQGFGERIHVVLLTHCPYNFLPPTSRQQGRAGGSSAAPLCYVTKANSITCCFGSWSTL